MKKLSLFILIVVFALSLSACGLFSNSKNKFDLDTPHNISFREDRTSLSWNSVNGASSYNVKVTYENGESIVLITQSTSLYLGSIAPGKINICVMAKNDDTNKKSDYSSPFSLDFIAPVDIDESSLKTAYEGDTLTINWGSAEHSDGYVLTYQIGEKNAINVELNETEYSIEYSESNLNCKITLYAKGSGNYKNGRKIHYTHIGIPDFDNPTATIVVDFNDPADAVFSFTYLLEATLDDNDISSLIDGGSKNFTIPISFWSNLSLGLHNLALVSNEEVKTYKLEIINSKTPELTIGDYMYDGNDLVGDLKAYGNNILGVCVDYSYLPQSQAQIVGEKVILSSWYLDKQPEGILRLNIAYNSPKSDIVKYLGFTVNISSALLELNSFSYNYDGENDLAIDISTNGDRVIRVSADGATVPSYNYFTSSNELIIKKEFLDKKEYKTFIIQTRKGGTMSFVVQYGFKGFVSTDSIYLFDKSNSRDLHIESVASVSDITVFGNKITTDFYEIKNGKLFISENYLSTLKSGVYEFAVFSGGVSSSFAIKVYASKGNIQNLKLDYDVSQSYVCIDFDCDCGDNEHYYKIFDELVKCESGDVVPNVDRTISQTITLLCKKYSDEKTYSISVPSDAKEYLKKSYTLNGKERDHYIESTEELAEVLSFISLGGNKIIIDNESPLGRSELTVYFSKQYLEFTKKNPKYFEEASSLVTIAYNCRFSLKGVGNIVTLTANFYYNPNEILSSGKQKEYISDITDYLSRGNRSQSFNAFPINSYEKEEFITTIADLERLPLNTRPVFANSNDPASKLYSKALSICRTYISDDMSDFEKVITFYHYLTTRVTYDTNALELYKLKSELENKNLNDAKSIILNALSSNGSLQNILLPLLDLNTTDEIVKTLYEKVLRLSSFSSYSAIVDGIAVCDGISSAMKLLCNIEGIECIEVSGLGITSSGSENHSWNKVKIDGKWYIIDATWGRNSGYVNHRYFMVDEYDIKDTHIENPDNVYNSVVQTPATGKFDYYVWNIEPYSNSDMCVQSEYELKNLVTTLKRNGELQFEIKLDFKYSSVQSVMQSLNITCNYIVFDNIVLIILKG